MNQRSTEIVQLLSKEKDEITVSGFAEYFQVSQKTIRNDLKEINTILNQNLCHYCSRGISTTINYQGKNAGRQHRQ